MTSKKSWIQRSAAILAVASCLVAATPNLTQAGGLPGFTLWGGPPPQSRLPFRLDFGGDPDTWDRYRLRIPAKKLELAVSQLSITYPSRFTENGGQFDPRKVKVKVKGVKKPIPLAEVEWDKENNVINIYPEEPIPARSRIEVNLSNVKNPSFGIYYFKCQILTPGDVALLRYIGTWDLSITAN